MNCQKSLQAVAEFQQWREEVYKSFGQRKSGIMELLDALSSNQNASSVVELSLNPLFRRDYNSLYKGIHSFLPTRKKKNYQKAVDRLFSVIASTIPQPTSRQFYLFGVDTTPKPRPYASTLPERSYIYQPNAVKGNKPINIGHSYSVVSFLPEIESKKNASWAIPLSGQRVSIEEKDSAVAAFQLKKILNHSSAPWKDTLSVLVADSLYSQRGFIFEQLKQENLVTVTRVRSNRVFYRQFISDDTQIKKRGHPRWYGDRFDLKNEATWHQADEIIQTSFTTKRGRCLKVTISGWKQMLMRGTKDYPMHRHPFTLLKIVISDERGKLIWKPMWLIVIGQERNQLNLQECYEAYRQRYDMEHLFRFGKQKLLMNAYFTPDVSHEENWFQLTLLAYVQLWAARKIAVCLPRPWESYLTKNEPQKITPSLVQRDFYRIISQIGTPAISPKPRGFSLGRIKGEKKLPRQRYQVIKKQSQRKKVRS